MSGRVDIVGTALPDNEPFVGPWPFGFGMVRTSGGNELVRARMPETRVTAAIALAVVLGSCLMTKAETSLSESFAADSGGFDPGGFDRDTWISAAGRPPKGNVRQAMVPALQDRLPGMTRAQVEALLGPPEESADTALVYLLSPVFFGESYRALRVDFGSDGRATDARDVSTETWQ